MITVSENRSGLQYYDPQEQAWTPRILEMAPTRAGIAVSEVSAMRCLTVYACIRAISEDIAKLPMNLYKYIENGGKERVRNHTCDLLRKQPNPEMSAYDFKRTLQGHVMSWGNGFAEIVFDGSGKPAQLWPLPPDRIKVIRNKQTGVVEYEVRANYNDNPVRLPAEKILHIKGLGFDGLVGYSPIRIAAESIGVTVAQERHAASFFGNGAYPGAILKHPGRLTQEAENNLKRSYENAFRGPDMHHRTMVLAEGMAIEKMTMSAEESQFLESRQFSVEEIARLFRIPPHKIGHLQRATFSNIEQQNTEYVTDCLMPHTVAWEQECDRKLNLSEDEFFRHRFTELLRGDAVARGTFYSQMRNCGIYSTNDIRDMENMNPVPEGDILLVQGAMISLEAAAKAQPQGQNTGEKLAEDDEEEPEKPIEDEKIIEKKSLNKAKIAENHVVLLAETLTRSLKIEAERCQKASKKPNFEGWKAEFYAGHTVHLRSAVRPIVHNLAACMEIEGNADALTEEIVKRHVYESYTGLTTSTVESTILGWNDSRATRFAKHEVENLTRGK